MSKDNDTIVAILFWLASLSCAVYAYGLMLNIERPPLETSVSIPFGKDHFLIFSKQSCVGWLTISNYKESIYHLSIDGKLNIQINKKDYILTLKSKALFNPLMQLYDADLQFVFDNYQVVISAERVNPISVRTSIIHNDHQLYESSFNLPGPITVTEQSNSLLFQPNYRHLAEAKSFASFIPDAQALSSDINLNLEKTEHNDTQCPADIYKPLDLSNTLGKLQSFFTKINSVNFGALRND